MARIIVENLDSAQILMTYSNPNSVLPRITDHEVIGGKLYVVNDVVHDRENKVSYVLVDDPYRKY